MCMSSRRRIYEAGIILWALQIFESSSKLRCRNLSSSCDRTRTCFRRLELQKYNTRSSLTWSRKFMNVWASFLRKLLATVIFTGQLKRDWTSDRHSLEVISIEYMSVQGCISVDWVSQCVISMLNPEWRRKGAPEGPGSQGMLTKLGCCCLRWVVSSNL